MSKWINTATGLVVPASEVQELAPGSGVFVHVSVIQQKQLVIGPRTRGGPAATVTASETAATVTASETAGPTKVIDGYAVKIGDDETYDPDVHNVQAQAAKAQATLFARGGLT